MSNLTIDFADTPLQIVQGGTFTPVPYVYVVDSLNHRVKALDYDGVFQFAWGSLGTGPGAFYEPYGVAWHDDYVYVADTLNYRVQVFDVDGNYQYEWGSFGSAAGKFNQPKGIVVDNNYVYVADYYNHRVQFFRHDGTYAYSIGSYGPGDGQMDRPLDLYDDELYLYVYDSGNDRTLTYTKNTIVDGGNAFWNLALFDMTADGSDGITEDEFLVLGGIQATIIPAFSARGEIQAEIVQDNTIEVSGVISAEIVSPFVTGVIKATIISSDLEAALTAKSQQPTLTVRRS